MRLKLPAVADLEAFLRHFQAEEWQRAAAAICARHRLAYAKLRRSPLGENIIFFVDQRFVVKIFSPARGQFGREVAALEFAEGKTCIETPRVVATGEIEGWSYLVMTYLAGRPMRELWPQIQASEQVEVVARLGVALRELHAHPAPLAERALNRDWREFVAGQARVAQARQGESSHGFNPEWLTSLPAYIDARLQLLPADYEPVLLHGDVHPGNVLLEERGGRWHLSALFDFGDSFCGFHEYEFVAPGVLMVQGRGELQRALLTAYGYTDAQLDATLRARLMLLTILYECSDLGKYAARLAPEAVHLTLDELERAIWKFACD